MLCVGTEPDRRMGTFSVPITPRSQPNRGQGPLPQDGDNQPIAGTTQVTLSWRCAPIHLEARSYREVCFLVPVGTNPLDFGFLSRASSTRMAAPFFIVGCVRSGTTLLRNLLRQHPNLACPEETHVFRWPEPFAGKDFLHIETTNPTLAHHQSLDGIDPEEVRQLLDTTTDRREFLDGYMALFLQRVGKPGGRWFDKTPQHVYGMLMIHAFYPDSPFIHIHRHPFNVVASLKQGRMLAPQSALGAANHWLEAVMLTERFRQLRPDLVLDVAYEALISDPERELNRILDFVGERPIASEFDTGYVHPEQNRYLQVLTREEIDLVSDKLGVQMQRLGYAPESP